MLKKSLLALSLGATLFIVGCNKAPQEATEKPSQTSKAITIGYSDYPGWVAWQIAIEKGWLKEAGVNVDFKWFDYSASLNAFSSKQIDAVTVSNGDNLVVSSGGTRGLLVMATSYSAGNDAVIAKSGIDSIQDLKGKTVALEKGLLSHLLFNTALQDAGMTEDQITIANALTNELPQVFNDPKISAVVAWQPVANQALSAVSGSKIIYSTEQKPGLIFDAVSVNAEHLMQNKDDWAKIVKVWDRVVEYIQNPETHDDAVRIMSTKVGVDPEQYKKFIGGTYFLDIKANKEVFKKSNDLKSIYGSSYNVNEFNIKYGVYDAGMEVDSSIYPDIINNME